MQISTAPRVPGPGSDACTVLKTLVKSAVAALCALCLTILPAVAQGLVRDAEIERTLQAVARPLLQKAGLPVQSPPARNPPPASA